MRPREVAPLRRAAKVDSPAPAGRDRAVDALRALAILGVVLGHWLVTAFVATDGQLTVASPLTSQPILAAFSWGLQTLAVFFLVGGYAAARGLDSARRSGVPYRSWLAARTARFARPVLALLAFWTLAAVALGGVGYSSASLRTVLIIVVSPLWFLAVYAGLTALTPLAVAAGHRLVPPLVVVVAVVDLIRFGLHGPAWLGWVNLLAGWLVPYCLGAAWSAGARLRPAVLLAGAAAATIVLVLWLGYPASMVGVPGDGRSNLNPPTLAAVTFGIAQVGMAILLHGPLTRLTRGRLAWAAVALVNFSAMTIYLWHQTALIGLTTFGLGYGRLSGLHTPPDDLWWMLDRLAWLPGFAAVLAVLVAVFGRFERSGSASWRLLLAAEQDTVQHGRHDRVPRGV